MRKNRNRPESDEPLSEGRVEYLEAARQRVRNRRVRRTAVLLVLLTAVVLFATGIAGSSVAALKDLTDTARIALLPGSGWPQQTGVAELEQAAPLTGSFVELGDEGCVVWSRTGKKLNSIQSGYARPALAAGKTRFVLYNRSGNELRVESRTQNLYTKQLENSIFLCAMSDNGTLAVVTEDQTSMAKLLVYSPSMEQQLSWSMTSNDGTPLRMAFSPDSRKLAAAAKQLEQVQSRIAELSRYIKRLYEDNVNGKISDERFMEMSADYEAEQRELKDRAAALQGELDKAQEATVNAEKFMSVVRKYLSIEELTHTLLREMVEKIVVYECEYDENEVRRQRIDIYYSFVGKIDLPEE